MVIIVQRYCRLAFLAIAVQGKCMKKSKKKLDQIFKDINTLEII